MEGCHKCHLEREYRRRNFASRFGKATNDCICKIIKPLYSLKQPPRSWLEMFAKVLKEKVVENCQGDHNLFLKHLNATKAATLLLYVDDITITKNNDKEK